MSSLVKCLSIWKKKKNLDGKNDFYVYIYQYHEYNINVLLV